MRAILEAGDRAKAAAARASAVAGLDRRGFHRRGRRHRGGQGPPFSVTVTAQGPGPGQGQGQGQGREEEQAKGRRKGEGLQVRASSITIGSTRAGAREEEGDKEGVALPLAETHPLQGGGAYSRESSLVRPTESAPGAGGMVQGALALGQGGAEENLLTRLVSPLCLRSSGGGLRGEGEGADEEFAASRDVLLPFLFHPLGVHGARGDEELA